jgi:hypothetical protein
MPQGSFPLGRKSSLTLRADRPNYTQPKGDAMLTRRQFHYGLMASLAVGLAPLSARATAPSKTALFLNRLSFGAGINETNLNPNPMI